MKIIGKIIEAITIPAILVTFWGLARLAQGTATADTTSALIIGATLTIICILHFERRRTQ